MSGQDLLQGGGGGPGLHAGCEDRDLSKEGNCEDGEIGDTFLLFNLFVLLIYNKLLNVSIDRNCIEINGAYLSLYQVSSVQDCI